MQVQSNLLQNNIYERIHECSELMVLLDDEQCNYIDRQNYVLYDRTEMGSLGTYMEKIILENAYQHYLELSKIDLEGLGFGKVYNIMTDFFKTYILMENNESSIINMFLLDNLLLRIIRSENLLQAQWELNNANNANNV